MAIIKYDIDVTSTQTIAEDLINIIGNALKSKGFSIVDVPQSDWPDSTTVICKDIINNNIHCKIRIYNQIVTPGNYNSVLCMMENSNGVQLTNSMVRSTFANPSAILSVITSLDNSTVLFKLNYGLFNTTSNIAMLFGIAEDVNNSLVFISCNTSTANENRSLINFLNPNSTSITNYYVDNSPLTNTYHSVATKLPNIEIGTTFKELYFMRSIGNVTEQKVYIPGKGTMAAVSRKNIIESNSSMYGPTLAVPI